MKKSIYRKIIVFLVLAMLTPNLAACKGQSGAFESDSNESTQITTESETTSERREIESEEETDAPEETVYPLDGEYGGLIANAERLANGVQAYYTDPERKGYRIENLCMSLDYSLDVVTSQQVTALKNTRGNTYIENTMDVFVKMTNGDKYYASASNTSTRANLFKYGYYYYDLHLLEQGFVDEASVFEEEKVSMRRFSGKSDGVAELSATDEMISFTVGGDDPYILAPQLSFSANQYNAVSITMRSNNAKTANIYLVAGSATAFSSKQNVSFNISNDGEFHTYTVLLSDVEDYRGKVKKLRLDVEGAKSGDVVEISEIKLLNISATAPKLLLDRNLHTYSDKMNQVLHFVAEEKVTGIAELGIETLISSDRVSKLVVKDANGLHNTLDGVDWSTAEYAGFDIRGTGVFGIILLPHENSGKLSVTLDGGIYTVTQASVPANGVILPPEGSTENNYSMGHRVYTDENHSFDKFIREAENERNPFVEIVSNQYAGYDALRGAYRFTISGTNFNTPFFASQNKYYTCPVTFNGGDSDRQIYIYTYYDGGTGEGAAVLSDDDMLIPIPVMIHKNFGSENEEPVFDAGDDDYSETLFPIIVSANETISLTVLNLYQNWGGFPLKQLSSIQTVAPYYHLSTGVTETSCIAPWYNDHYKNLWTLADFRTMSGKYWFEYKGDLYENSPQHTHAGYRYFLEYTDDLGNYSASENINNTIMSSGLNYAEVLMDYISDDGRIKVTYNHIEMPQTDEHRAYYEINYEVLEDISFSDFKNQFAFHTSQGYAGTYQKLGYLDVNNKITYTNATVDQTLILGDQCPYVSLYDLEGRWENKCGNIGFVIYDSDITVGGEKFDGNFALVCKNLRYRLTLNVDRLTLKKGDRITINMILVPWGDESSKDDSNMLKIRESSCLDPLRVTVAKGEKIESVFVPRIMSTDGKTAEFTLSGGTNNSVVRVYGFDKLTSPEIYELVEGKWTKYDPSSFSAPDSMGNMHYYDGYFAYYDGDGKYSYTFIVDMTDAENRTFRIEASKDFEKWPEMIKPENDDPINQLIDPTELADAANGNASFGKIELSEDGSYVRFYGTGDPSVPEACFTAYTSVNDYVTGQYFVIKYRFPKENAEAPLMQVFTSTVNAKAVANERFNMTEMIKDGNWHIVIADLTKQSLPTYMPNGDGKYVAQHLRLDVFNSVTSADSYVDIAYVGLSDSIEGICALENELANADVVENGRNAGTLDFKTGSIVEKIDLHDPDLYIDKNSGWTASSTAYVSAIDFINSKGEGDGPYSGRGGRSTTGVDIVDFNGMTEVDRFLVISGWSMVYEGVDKYMWSADGGKTWNDCQLYGMSDFAVLSETSGIVKAADRYFNDPNYSSYKYSAKSSYQSGGISADLSKYAGQTVNVTFAVVPLNDPDGLCLLAHIKNVTVIK